MRVALEIPAELAAHVTLHPCVPLPDEGEPWIERFLTAGAGELVSLERGETTSGWPLWLATLRDGAVVDVRACSEAFGLIAPAEVRIDARTYEDRVDRIRAMLHGLRPDWSSGPQPALRELLR